jgi:hypothetical protein
MISGAGRGKVTYIQEGASESSSLEVQRGDVYNFEQGSILYIQSYPNATRERIRIYAVFTSNAISSDDPSVRTILQVQSASVFGDLSVHYFGDTDEFLAPIFQHPTSEAYTGVSNLLKGFDAEILRLGFGVSA